MLRNFPYLPGDKFIVLSDKGFYSPVLIGDELFCVSIESLNKEISLYYFVIIRTYEVVNYSNLDIDFCLKNKILKHLPRKWEHNIPKTLFCESFCPLSSICNITGCPIEKNEEKVWTNFYLPGDEVIVKFKNRSKLYKTTISKISIFPVNSLKYLQDARESLGKGYYNIDKDFLEQILEYFDIVYSSGKLEPNDVFYSVRQNAAPYFPEDIVLSDETELRIRLHTRRGFSILPNSICDRCIISSCKNCKLKNI